MDLDMDERLLDLECLTKIVEQVHGRVKASPKSSLGSFKVPRFEMDDQFIRFGRLGKALDQQNHPCRVV